MVTLLKQIYPVVELEWIWGFIRVFEWPSGFKLYMYHIQFGYLLEVFFFSMGLSYKIRQIRLELFDEKLRNSQLEKMNAVIYTENGSMQNDAFLSRIRACIEANLVRSDYSVSDLCQDAGLSRTSLHNELKKRTGKSTTDFINHIRLIKAKELLLQGSFSISEVAHKVGYNEASYFSKLFKKEFGFSPKDIKRPFEQ